MKMSQLPHSVRRWWLIFSRYLVVDVWIVWSMI